MRDKYLTLLEDYHRRHERGGFQIGDVFKLHKNFKSLQGYKDLSDGTKKMLDEMLETGLHLRVVDIKSSTSPRYPGNPQTSSNKVELTIALDTGGGRYTHHLSITPELGTPEFYYPNLPPIPDSIIRKDKITIKPEELKYSDNISNKTDRGNGKLTKSEISLPTKNTVIPSKTNKESNYTYRYLDGLK